MPEILSGDTMTPEQRFWWKVALELKMRKSSGDAFQDFFSTVMAARHGSDFVRVRPFGKLGDKGCDGYLMSSGQLFQCYGALNGDGGKVDYLIGKMEKDFSKANANFSKIMKEWHMVHNLVDGLPAEAILKLTELKETAPTLTLGFVSMEGFEERIFALDDNVIENLLGMAATSKDMQNIQAAELRDVVAAVAAEADNATFDTAAIKPVPPDKLEFNKLPGHWRSLIASGWQSSAIVDRYLSRHPDPLIGERIAQVLRDHYKYLKAQNLTPGDIMSSLYEMVAGTGTVSAARQVAALALLAYLFEKCEIFEDDPSKVTS
jgi:hypothetical protein